MNIRRFEPEEWRVYRDIRLRALLDAPDAFGSTYEGSLRYSDDEWASRLRDADPRTDYPMAAAIDDSVVGLGWGRIDDRKAGVAHLFQMWVAPGSRGHGLGRALVEAAIAWARAEGIRQMMLDVTCTNEPARRLYESAGFAPAGEPQPLRPGSDILEQPMVLELHS